MAKKKKQQGKKAQKKTLLKEIEIRLTETFKDFHNKTSAKKLDKQIHKAGKILVKSITRKQITVVHKEKNKEPEKNKKIDKKEVVS
jgi:hypothetical protein